MFILIAIGIVIAILVVQLENSIGLDYMKTSYYQTTGNSPLSVYFDRGRLGEYMIYRYLRSAEQNGARFLFNIYIPKSGGGTTEIDVLMIHTKGIFVFESKNYSGWIFGNEKQQNWCQTLPAGRGRSQKQHFFNPVIQNRSHIKHLQELLGSNIPYHSVVVFSERCELKKITMQSNIPVVKRNQVYDTVASIVQTIPSPVLTQAQIDSIYNKLFPYSQVSAETKAKHNADIHASHRKEQQP